MNKVKHHIISILLLLGNFLHTQAQDTLVVQPGQLDSLRQLIEKSKEDTNRVILLNEYAKLCFYDLEYLNGLVAVQEARDLSRKLKYDGGETWYYKTISHFHRGNTLGEYYLIISDWKNNEGIPSDALTSASAHPDGVYDDDLDRIQKQLLLALDSLENKGDKEIVAHILFAVFQNYEKQNNPDMATVYWDLAYNDFVALEERFPQLFLLVKKITYLRLTNTVDSARQLELKAINLVDKTEDLKLKGLMFFVIGNHYLFTQGRSNLALEYYLKSVDALEEIEGDLLYMQLVNLLGAAYSWSGNDEKKGVVTFEKVLKYYQDIVNSNKEISEGLERQMVWVYTNIAGPLIALNRFDEAERYLELAPPIAAKYNLPLPYGRYYQFKAALVIKQGRFDDGLKYNLLALEKFTETGVSRFISEVFHSIAQQYQLSGNFERALQNAMEAYNWGLKSNRAHNAIDASLTVAEIFEQVGQTRKANEFLKVHLKLRDENDALNAAKHFEDVELRSLLESQNREIASLEKDRSLQEQEHRNQQLWIFSISGALISAIILAIILFRHAQNRKKANIILGQKNEEIESTLNKLKSTQSQLIQSEKMASLGELTAGIAHEIQNPLNFVNNFSEVNEELAQELEQAIDNGNSTDAKALAKDIKANQEKILHHGKRADAIVKGMLQHSRTSSGQKEFTDLNALCDEYLRLSYHGLRAKDKSFNARFETDFDASLPKINVVPQDIGRVILNLINNAFYAVNARLNESFGQEKSKQNIAGYEPTVWVSTRRVDSPLGAGGSGGSRDKIQIKVKDNGNGIPDSIKEKIFQPFFTTKPTGQGTGLGLSLSYDIVKAHGGELSVRTPLEKAETKEGEGSEFIIIIPYKN